MSIPIGKFVWYELMTPDPAAAVAFYTGLVGWRSKDAGMEGMPYTLLQMGEAQIAGVMGYPPDAAGYKPMWSGYISVDDVDGYEAKVLRAGGKVLRPAMDIPDIGRFAAVADPQQASFILFKPATEDPPPRAEPDSPGTPGWHELLSTDGAAAFEFYSTLFGWRKGEAIDMGPMGVYQIFEIDGVPAGGMMTKPAEMPAPAWNYYFVVDDIQAAAQRVATLGGRVLMGPHEVPGGSWIVNGTDPQGAMFSVVKPAPRR